MNTDTRRRFLQWGCAAATAAAWGRASACEFWTSNLRIKHPWTRATPADAPFAIVCMTFDEVMQEDRLIRIETPVARGAELAGVPGSVELDLLIKPGSETVLSEKGVHLRLTGLTQPLEIAHAYPMRLVFEKAGAVNTDLSVDYARFR